MPRQLLIDYLERQRADFARQTHSVAYTAPQTAAISRIKAHNFAKVVMIKVDGELAMMVLPAHYLVDLVALKSALAAERLELATEREFGYRFPRCEAGAMPPFGHLFGLQTYIAPVFEEHEEIAFNAGSHSELIRMPFREYRRLAHAIPVPAGFAPPSMPITGNSHYSMGLGF